MCVALDVSLLKCVLVTCVTSLTARFVYDYMLIPWYSHAAS